MDRTRFAGVSDDLGDGDAPLPLCVIKSGFPSDQRPALRRILTGCLPAPLLADAQRWRRAWRFIAFLASANLTLAAAWFSRNS